MSVKKLSVLVALALAAVTEVKAFSLIGPFQEWQVEELGMNLPGDIGAPKNLGEEYRMSTGGTIVYGYDLTFLNYFGQAGVDAVEEAIKILNDLPAFSSMSPDLREFPLDTRRVNYRASALGVRDIKSWALGVMLEGLGLASPERFVFTLRARVVIDEIPFYTTIKRNFDPATLEPSSFINGTFYSGQVVQIRSNPDWFAATGIPVDPLSPSYTSVASWLGIRPGMFYTGLTRDDVGGLRYLYRRSNLNVENVVPNATTGLTGGSTIGGDSNGGGSSPWLPVPGAGIDPNQQPGGGGVDPGGGGVAPTPATNVVDVALRPGPDKLRFVRADADSLLGIFTTNTVLITDVFITNGVTRQQMLQRTVTQPDFIFSATDIGHVQGVPLTVRRVTEGDGYQNNAALNTFGGNEATMGGPGVILTPFEITFNNVGPWFINERETDEASAIQVGLVWGSFDGSTNAPIVFPQGLTIQQLEQVISVRTGTSPWRLPQ